MKTVEIILGFFGFAAAQAPRPTMPGTVDTMSKFREEYGTFVPDSIKASFFYLKYRTKFLFLAVFAVSR